MKFSNLFKPNLKERELELAEAQLYDAKMLSSSLMQELLLKQAMVDYADKRVKYLKTLVTSIKGEHDEDKKLDAMLLTSSATTKAPFSR